MELKEIVLVQDPEPAADPAAAATGVVDASPAKAGHGAQHGHGHAHGHRHSLHTAGSRTSHRLVTSKQLHRVSLRDTHPCDPSHLRDDCDDIATMNNMHEAPLLNLLERRYAHEVIYTFTGDILISINPYKLIHGLYSIPDALPDYAVSRHPHVYAVAERAYKHMLLESDPAKKNQSMIVSGESGAGKTEACKHIMRYLATLSERYCERKFKRHSVIARSVSVEKKVLDCNPFLEAFGNAKTVRNDNSSRFGKFLKIQYDEGRILGARMRHYLLEKARVVAPQTGERNYHIFYQLTRGAEPEERAHLHLKGPEEYAYLTSGGLPAMDVEGVDDSNEFVDVKDALETVGVDPATQTRMFEVLAGILHLGNTRFSENAKNEAAIAPASAQNAQHAADLLGAPMLPTKLVRRLMKVKGRNSSYEVLLTAKQALVARDSLAKTIYERLFTWLIAKCNRMLSTSTPTSGFIGILDIFGFEIFEQNSFEQLCINYANEKLQNLFNVHIFVMEQEQYRLEGVDVTTIEFINNQLCVDLIEKKPLGVLSILDEICFLGRDTTDAAFLEKLDKAHKGKNDYYGNPKVRSLNKFSVVHFAGEVAYCVDGFIDKNNDTLYTDLEELMVASSQQMVREIFDDAAIGDAHEEDSASTPVPATSSAAAKPAAGAAASQQKTQSTSTIASKFRRQLHALNETLMATSPHYVRCVKPNKIKKPHHFDHPMILAQLLYAGVLETVRIRRQGFPFRETFPEFWRRACKNGLQMLVPACVKIPLPPPPEYVVGPDGKTTDVSLTADLVDTCRRGSEVLCRGLLPAEKWTMGKTKVFLKDGALDMMLLAFRTHHSIRIQAWWRMARQRRSYRRFRRSIIRLQKAFRGIIIRRKFSKVSKHVAKIQACYRGRVQRMRFRRLLAVRRNAVDKIQATYKMHRQYTRYQRFRRGLARAQALVRGSLARHLKRRMLRAIVTIQAGVRGFLARRKAQRIRRLRKDGAVMIQSAWRGHRRRAWYKWLQRGARTLSALYRGKLARREARRRWAALLTAQAFVRQCLARIRVRRMRRAVIRIQVWFRSQLAARHYRKIRRAVKRIERAMLAYIRGKVLNAWVQEAHAAASWGECEELANLLSCAAPAWARLRDIPLRERARMRNRQDGMKTLLHSAAASGSLETVQLLVQAGADHEAVDLVHATALHKAVAIGDSHLPVIRYLISLAGENPEAVADYINRTNVMGETAVDVALAQYRGGGRREHDDTVRLLLELGGVAKATGATREQIEALLRKPRGDALLVQAAAARERELLERRARERRDDPHYQFLFVADQERAAREQQGLTAKEKRTAPVSRAGVERFMATVSAASATASSSGVTGAARPATAYPAGPYGPNNDSPKPTAGGYAAITSAAASMNLSADSAPLNRGLPGLASATGAPLTALDVAMAQSRAESTPGIQGGGIAPLSPLAQSGSRGAASVAAPANSQTPMSPQTTAINRGNSSFSLSGGMAAQAAAAVPAHRSVQPLSTPSVATPGGSSPAAFAPAASVGRSATTASASSVVRGATFPGGAKTPKPAAGAATTTAAAPSATTPVQRSAQQASTASAVAEPCWTVHQSTTTGLLYYYNGVTGQTQWTEPADFDAVYEPWQLEVIKRVQAVRNLAAATGPSNGAATPSSGAPGASPQSPRATGASQQQQQQAALAAQLGVRTRASSTGLDGQTIAPGSEDVARNTIVTAGAMHAVDVYSNTVPFDVLRKAASPDRGQSTDAAMQSSISSHASAFDLSGADRPGSPRSMARPFLSHARSSSGATADSDVARTPSSSPALTQDSEGIASDWETFHTAEGRPYYYNASKGKTQWAKPACLASAGTGVASPSPSPSAAAYIGGRPLQNSAQQGQSQTQDGLAAFSSAVMAAPALTSALAYGSATTKPTIAALASRSIGDVSLGSFVSSASLSPAATPLSPTKAAAALAASASAASGAATGRRTVGLGRNGWMAAVDEHNRIFYFNSATGGTTWDRPVDY
jgi:myosin-5